MGKRAYGRRQPFDRLSHLPGMGPRALHLFRRPLLPPREGLRI